MPRFSANLLLTLASLFIIISNGVIMRYKILYGGDEIISYLCATGNSMNYEQVLHHESPYGEIADAGTYQSYLQEVKPFCFKKIASDLCANDLHPPLYFWILHLVVLLFGTTIYSGILLNLAFQFFSLFSLFKLASLLFNDAKKGAFAALLWAVNPACLLVSFHARPYELLMFITILYFFFFYKWVVKQNTLNSLSIVFIGALGLLIHYSFMYVMASAVVYSFFKLKTIGVRYIIVIGVGSILSFGMMTLVHPCYADSFLLQQMRKQPFAAMEIIPRIGKTVISYTQFFFPVLSFKQPDFPDKTELFWGIGISIPILLLLAAYIYRKRLSALWVVVKAIHLRYLLREKQMGFALTLFGIVSVIILAPYLLFVTPFHAMGGQYLVYVYPLMAIISTYFLFLLSKKTKVLFACILIAESAIVLAVMIWWNQAWYIRLIEQVQTNNVIVVNDIDRRAFPRLIPYLKPDQLVLLDETILDKNELMEQLLRDYHTVLFITSKEPTEKENYTLYDTNDGVTFYTRVLNDSSSFSVSPAK